MVKRARIKLTSTDTDKLGEVCQEIKDIAKKTGVKIVGPIPLPTKKLVRHLEPGKIISSTW